MTPTTTFGTRLIGQTEKALNAILGRLLAESGLTEPQWVTLNLAVAGGEPIDVDELTHRVAGVLKVDRSEAHACIVELGDRRLVDMSGEEGAVVTVTDEGRDFRDGIGGVVAQITERLWGDLPTEDLDVTARVLSTVLARVDGELAVL